MAQAKPLIAVPHLTPTERETVIVMDDSSDTVTITTHQRRIYTKLRNNPAFELVEDLSYGSSIGGRFVGPAAMISFRSKRREKPAGSGSVVALLKAA